MKPSCSDCIYCVLICILLQKTSSLGSVAEPPKPKVTAYTTDVLPLLQANAPHTISRLKVEIKPILKHISLQLNSAQMLVRDTENRANVAICLCGIRN